MKKVFIYNTVQKAQNYLKVLDNLRVKYIVSQCINDAKCCTHLLLCGGGDVHPYLYGKQIENCYDIDINRDLSEIHLIKSFIKNNLPILGICRGMQIINVALGGELSQKIKDKFLHFCDKGDLLHPIENTSSFMTDLFGKYKIVNSAHRQKINVLANGLKPASFSEDFSLEAFYGINKKVFGVQFHPERLTNDKEKLFDYFLSLKY